MSINIDAAIFIGFLVVNLALGLWSSRGINNIKEYAIGNRNFSTSTIAATIIATWASGNSIGMASFDSHSMGVFFLIPGLADVISLLLISYLIAPRIGEFFGTLSVADAMGGLYGSKVRAISAISGIMPAIGNVAIQFVILCFLLGYAFNISSIPALLVSSFIVIAYSTFGGIKAVTFTDMIQFFTFGVVIPMTAFLIWKSIGNVEAISHVLNTNPIFDYSVVFDLNNPNFSNMLLLFFFFLLPGLDPAIFQRIVIAKSTKQVSRSFWIAGVTMLCLYAIFWLIGILILSDGNNHEILEGFMQPTQLMSYILDNYMSYGFKGLFIIGLVAMMMSTADSYINCSAVLFSHDLCKSFNVNLSEKKELFLARVSAFFIGTCALLLSLFSTNLLDIILSTYSFYMPIVSVPLLLAIFGFRSTPKAVLIGMSSGFITVMSFKLLSDSDSLMYGMIMNLMFLIGSHYILKQKGGWVGIKDNGSLIALREERVRTLETCIQKVRNFNFLTFCRSNLPREEKLLVYFGLFCIISAFSNAYSLSVDIHNQYATTLEGIYYFILITSTIFITYPFWLDNFKSESFIAVLWNIALFFNLAFCSSLFVVLSKFSFMQITILMANLITVAVLMRWKAAIFVIISGVIASTQLYTHYTKQHFLPDNLDNLEFKIIYTLLIVSSILIAFFKPKQEYVEATEQKAEVLEGENAKLSFEVSGLNDQVTDLNGKVVTLNTKVEVLNEQVIHYTTRIADHEKEMDRLGQTSQRILNNVNHELRLPIGNVVNFADMLHETLQKTENNKLLTELAKEVYDNSYRVSGMILNMLDLATLAVQKVDLEKKTVNLSELIEDRVTQCRKIYQKDKSLEFKLKVEPEIMIAIDPNYIRQTVDNLLINAITFSEKGEITIKFKKEAKEVIFTITDQGKGIPKNELYDIFIPFKMGSNSESKACGRGVGLALCKSAVQAHGGSILADSDGVCGAKLQFTLPFIATS